MNTRSSMQAQWVSIPLKLKVIKNVEAKNGMYSRSEHRSRTNNQKRNDIVRFSFKYQRHVGRDPTKAEITEDNQRPSFLF